MIPTRWRRFEKLPLTSSGKIDAKRIDWTGSTKGNTTQTGHLQLICSQVLGYSVDMSLSLAENGGDSLIAMEIAALTAQDGLPVAPETLLSAKRLAEISGNDQMHATLLRELADRVKLPNGSKVVRPLQKVFLIGATGFLGRQVLAALQEKFEVIALVRSGACDLKNCEVVIGDITRPKFGLSRADYARALECTDIVNCSGVVNLACDLQQHLPVNFYALQNVLEFQAVGGLGLHQISTLSVFVHTDYIPDNCSTSDPLDSAKIVYGGYAQSKFAADILMQRAEKDRHVHLIRPGLITPHRDKPEWGKNDLLRKFIKGIIELGAVPALADVRFDVTPVDWLAGEIANGVICRTSRT
jgi:dTDP-4-dehydrorhamnose reductase